MLTLFVVTTILLAIAVLFLLAKLDGDADLQYVNSQFWYGKWLESEENFVKLSGEYDALDQGNTEIEENYQQEILSLYDQTEKIQESCNFWIELAGKLEQIRLDHDCFCLPNVGTDFYPMSDDEETPVYDSIPKG